MSRILYVDLGYLSNTVLGAVSIIAMALLVQRAVPEPEPNPQPAAATQPADGAVDEPSSAP